MSRAMMHFTRGVHAWGQSVTNGTAPPSPTRRNMQFRMPRLQNTQELGVMWDLMPNLIGHDADMSSPELSRPMWNIHLAEKPTSRTQAQQLATWFGTQIATLAEHGKALKCPCAGCGVKCHAGLSDIFPPVFVTRPEHAVWPSHCRS